MSIRTSQVLFGVAGARCIWSRPAAESSAKRGWGCGSNQPAAGPERSSGGIGPRWWWAEERREGEREKWREGGREGANEGERGKEKQPPITLPFLFSHFLFSWACYSTFFFVTGATRSQKNVLKTIRLSPFKIGHFLCTLVTEKQPRNLHKREISHSRMCQRP